MTDAAVAEGKQVIDRRVGSADIILVHLVPPPARTDLDAGKPHLGNGLHPLGRAALREENYAIDPSIHQHGSVERQSKGIHENIGAYSGSGGGETQFGKEIAGVVPAKIGHHGVSMDGRYQPYAVCPAGSQRGRGRVAAVAELGCRAVDPLLGRVGNTRADLAVERV